MGTYVNSETNQIVLGSQYDYDDAIAEIAAFFNVGTRSDGKYYLADVLSASGAYGINKWALRKPIRSSKNANISDDDIIAAKCGLSPVSVTKLLQRSMNSTAYPYTKDDCLAEVSEWTYNRPRGVTSQYTEWFRLRDLDYYIHTAVAPDGDWKQKTISLELLNELQRVNVVDTITGDYGKEYNFKLDPQLDEKSYYGGLYDTFSMKFGTGTGEGIGTIRNMQIPIKYIAQLDGAWRVSLALYVPSYKVVISGKETTAGDEWHFFTSRKTIEQHYADSNSQTREMFPDLGTNPYACKRIAEYLSANKNYATFDVVPLLIKNLGNEKVNDLFNLKAVSGKTEAYCMPSGASAVQFICGTAPAPVYYETDRVIENNTIKVYITNTDSVKHTFGYTLTRVSGGNKTETTGSVTLNGGEKRQISGQTTGTNNDLRIKVTSQDGVEV